MNQDYSKLSQTIGLMNCKEEEPYTPQDINEIDTENIKFIYENRWKYIISITSRWRRRTTIKQLLKPIWKVISWII